MSENNNIAKAFFSLWVDFLTENQQQIIHDIPDDIAAWTDDVRAYLHDCDYARLITNAAALEEVAMLLGRFCEQVLGYTDDYLKQIYSSIKDEAFSQMNELKELSPEKVWLQAVRDSIDSGVLKIANEEREFLHGVYDGFYDEKKLLVCCVTKVEKIVNEYAYQRSLGVKWTKALELELISKRVLIADGHGKARFKFSKNRSVSPNRPNMIIVDLEVTL